MNTDPKAHPISEAKRVERRNRRLYGIMTIIYGVFAGLTGIAAMSLSFGKDPIKVIALFIGYGLAYWLFTNVTWHLFEHHPITISLTASSFTEMRQVDQDKLWQEIQKRSQEEIEKDDENQTPSA